MTTVLHAEYPQEECVPAKKPDLNNDGVVNYKDLWKVGRSFRLPKTDYRFIPTADSNCDGQVDDLDWSYVLRSYNKVYPILPEVDANIGINVPEKLYIGGPEADFKDFMYMSSFKSPFTIKLTYQITPADGLSVKTNLPNQVVKVGQNQAVTMSHYYHWDQSFSFHIKAEKVGTYQFIIRAKIPEDEKVIEEIKTIQVLPNKKADLNPTLSVVQYPTVEHEISSAYWLDVNITMTGRDVADIEKIEIIDENTGKSRRVTEDFNSGHSSVGIGVDRAFMQNQQCKSIHALITTPYDSITSKTVKFCATAIKSPESEPEPPKPLYPTKQSYLNSECILCH